MADDLTADDLLRGAGEARDSGHHGEADRLARAADLMDQGWRLTPPPQSGSVTVNVDDLRELREAGAAFLLDFPDDECVARALDNTAALAEADRDR